MYIIVPTKNYEKSLKKIRKSGTFKKQAEENLAQAIDCIASKIALPPGYKDHQLTGEFREYRECHIKGDVLLVYQILQQELVLVLVDIGTHSYLNL